LFSIESSNRQIREPIDRSGYRKPRRTLLPLVETLAFE
jgi:hypothetical protein